MAQVIEIPKMQSGEDLETYRARVHETFAAMRENGIEADVVVKGNPISFNPTVPSGSEMGDRWQKGLKTGVAKEKYLAGVKNPRANAIEAAIEQAGFWAAQLQEAITAGRYEAGLEAAGRDSSEKGAVAYGADNLQRAATDKADKATAAFQKLSPLIKEAQAVVLGMPSGSVEERRDRMNANFDEMRAIKDKFRS